MGPCLEGENLGAQVVRALKSVLVCSLVGYMSLQDTLVKTFTLFLNIPEFSFHNIFGDMSL